MDDINVAKDIALCRNCSQTFSFAELNEERDLAGVNLSQPPRGVWYRNQGGEFEVGTSTRSWAALFLVPFTAVWAGGSLAGIYGSQIVKHKFEPALSLFGLPFLIGSVVLISFTLMSVFGRLRVRGSGDQGEVFTGIGPLGWRRRFRWGEIRAVRCSLTQYAQNGVRRPLIELEGTKPVRFGSGLSEEKRDFFLAVLRQRVR